MMKNFIVGLLTGFIIFFLYIQVFSKSSTTPSSSQTLSNQTSKKSVSKDTKKSNISSAESEKNKSIILAIKDNLVSEKERKENDFIIPTKKNEPNTKREKLIELAMKISDDELEKAILSLNQALKPDPDRVFLKEVRDESKSLLRESELEQRFYEHQPYNGSAKIGGVECRVTLCKLSLSYPVGANFNKKQMSKFSRDIEITHIGEKNKSNQVKVVIYIAIKD